VFVSYASAKVYNGTGIMSLVGVCVEERLCDGDHGIGDEVGK